MPKKTPRRPSRRRHRRPAEHLTLGELARRAGVSVVTARRYREAHGDQLPSTGEGRRRRYLPEAVEALRSLVAGRRTGRAVASEAGPPTRRGRAKSGLLSLRRISQLTGIAYPTLMRYVARHGQRIPQQGSGRQRRFLPEAVPVFQELRAHRGRLTRGEEVAARGRKGGDPQLLRRLQALEEAHAELTRKMRRLQRMLDRPWRVTLSRSR